MRKNYEDNIKLLKALGEVNRLKIVDMLSTGEKCACIILENFHFTQPTLSHHMKVLIDSGIVKCRKEGTWMYYRLDTELCDDFIMFLNVILSNEDKSACG